MLRRTAQFSVGLFLAFCPVLLSGQGAQPQYFIFCAAQAPPAAAGAPATVYYSGIMQGTAANMASFRTDFAQFLMQKYSYKGAAACAPANSMVNAQTMMNNQQTAFRNAKRNVVDTGWTEGGAAGILGGSNPLGSISNPLGSILGGGQPNTAAPTNQTKAAATGTQTAQTTAGAGQQGQATGRGGAGGSNGGNQSTFNNVFGQIFGNGGGGGNSGGNGGGAKPAQGQPAANTKLGQGGTSATGGTGGGGGGGNQSPFAQVSSVIFGNKGGNGGGGNNGGGRGGQPGQPGQPGPANGVVEGNNATGQPGAPGGGKGGQPAQPNGVLGSAQFGTTKLDIYGCARQDTQVACVAELTNQNPKDTLVKSADIWKDAFIVDDRGDRHTRTSAFFLNIDGEQRPQLDISNGKSAKFVLMFDQVPTKVQKVTLRSQTGGLDVEDMGLLAPDGSTPNATTASAPAAH